MAKAWKGKWEGEDSNPTRKRTSQSFALSEPPAPTWVKREASYSAWADPRVRPLLLLSILMSTGVSIVACAAIGLIIYLQRESLGVMDTLYSTGLMAPTPTPKPITETTNMNINGTPIAPAIPTALTFAENTFAIQPMQLNAKQTWQYDPSIKKTGYWAAGTMVNYVIGLPATLENTDAFNQIATDNIIFLTTGQGALRYRVTQIGAINSDDPTLLRNQTSPRLTLLLLGEGNDESSLVVAEYTDEAVANETVGAGTLINLGDVQVAATGSRLVLGNEVGLPPGSNYYQVNVRVRNLMTTSLEASQFFAELIDNTGVRVGTSAIASAANGASGWATGTLKPKGEAGDVMTLTAGFEVSSTLVGPNLIWQFGTRKESPDVARVALIYKAPIIMPTPLPTVPPRADVKITNADISPDGSELRVVGEIRNLTNQPLTVSLVDLKLDTATGQPIALKQALPTLSPAWTISPNESLVFRVSFVRPPPGEVVFSLFERRFSILAS